MLRNITEASVLDPFPDYCAVFTGIHSQMATGVPRYSHIDSRVLSNYVLSIERLRDIVSTIIQNNRYIGDRY